MIETRLAEVAQVLGARIRPEGGGHRLDQQPFPYVSIDSRSLAPGQCFVAIKGSRFDGHDFIEQAVAQGARVIIHSLPYPTSAAPHQTTFLQVADTFEALQTLAHYVRRKWGKTLVAVTGSLGKTTTREFAATLLREKYEVMQSPGNLNNEFGVPLSLLKLEERHEVAVLELGMNHAGEIARLAAISAPDTGIITNIAPVHLEFFSGLSAIAEAKGELLRYLPADGQLIVNADDPLVLSLSQRFSGRKISFSLNGTADVTIPEFRFRSLQDTSFRLNILKRQFQCRVPFAGRHFLLNIAAAAAIALALDLSSRQIAAGIRRFQPVPMRGTAVRAEALHGGQFTLLDDSYNASPVAVRSQLEIVGHLSGFRRKIYALGEMLELGESSAELHRQIGREAARTQPHLLVTVGPVAIHIQQGALEEKFPEQKTRHFESSDQAADFLASEVRGGDFLLVKGSRAVRMDRVVCKLGAGKELHQT